MKRRGLMRTRQRTLAVTVVVAMLVLGAGFLAGRLVRSPAQQAADASGPGPTLLTVPIRMETLTAQVVTRGDVSAGTQTNIDPPAGGTSGSSSTPIVTRVAVSAGQQINQGQVLAEVSGRPVFALTGNVPAYRDLRPGYQGADVRQLQEDLKAMGFGPSKVDGNYGEQTKTAVKKFYESIGYQPEPTNPTDAQQLQTAASSVQQAQWAVEDAQKTLDQALTAADNNQDDPAVQTAATALSRARTQLSEAKTSQNQIISTTGPIVPLGEYAFIPSFPARAATIKAEVGASAPSPLMTVASGELRAVGTVNAGQAGLVNKGQSVSILLETTNTTASGVIASAGTITGDSPPADAGDSPPAGAGDSPPAPAGDTSSAGDVQIVVTPADGSWPSSLWGQNVRLTINGESTGDKKLVVPVSALFASADHTTRVTVVASNGTQTDVQVTVGITAGGYAAITPAAGATLVAGEKVVVSAGNAPPAGGP
jgi:hypothetical protein